MQDGDLEGIQNKTGDISGAQSRTFQNTEAKNFNEEEEEEGSSKRKYIIIGGAALVIVVLAIVLPITLTGKGGGRFIPKGTPPGPAPVPLPNSFYNHYTVQGQVTNNQDSQSGVISQGSYNSYLHQQALKSLERKLMAGNDQHNFGVNSRAIPTGSNNALVQNVSFNFYMPDYHVAALEMTDADNARYYVPNDVWGRRGSSTTMRLEMLGFQLNTNPFSFSFTDLADPTNWLLHTNQSSLVFMDKFIQIDIQLPSQNLYGLGERVHEFTLGEGTWTMWAKGADSPVDDGSGGKQVYGVHPFVMVQTATKGDYVGLWFRNSNAQSPLITFNADGSSTLTYITTGGVIELYMFIHGGAKQMIQQYHNWIGHPSLPPFWSLGWQQASWKYQKQSDVTDMISKYNTANMPLETVYLDIPYMNKYADFSVDTVAFPDVKGMAANLHTNNQRLVVILDAGLSADDTTNTYYQQAQDKGCLIKSAISKDATYKGALVQKVWPDHTVFLDWWHKDAQTIWAQGISDLYGLTNFDGLWIDMNEATGFCDGECYNGGKASDDQMYETVMRRLSEEERPLLEDQYVGNDTTWYQTFQNQNSPSTYFLPFIPGTVNFDNMAMSLNATHPSTGYSEYDVHNLYGFMMAKTTQLALMNGQNNPDNRPFVLTRSTFSGSGMFASHWLGDNWQDWNYLRYSISGIMNMNMFGISHAGADVCGFFGEKKDDEMCARWIQLSTFYPLARAHQNLTWKGGPSDNYEPYTLSASWQKKAQASMYDRYQYLRHVYTCLFEVNQWGGTCFDPLFYYYPDDDSTYKNIDTTFIVGGALKVSPILAAGVADGATFTSYFPQGAWVNMADFSVVNGGQNVNLKEQQTVNAHLRPGSLISFQDNSQMKIKTTKDLLAAPISLVVNRDINGFATGSLLLDQGISRSEIYNSNYEYYTFQFSSKSLNKFMSGGQLGKQNGQMDKLVITNAGDLSTTNFACFMDYNFQSHPLSFTYDTVKQTLTLANITKGATVSYSVFKSVHFGDSAKDINLCAPLSYSYKIKGVEPDLTQRSTSFILTNKGQTDIIPDIQVNLMMNDLNVININWQFVKVPRGQRNPFPTPKEMINPTIEPKLKVPLSRFVSFSDDPFVLSIHNGIGTKVIDIMREMYSSWVNVVSTRAYLIPGGSAFGNFNGVFGLGERVQVELPYGDGIYSMYTRDAGTPVDQGTVPGANVYGNHPLYLFQSDIGTWTGVYTNLVQAQDWYVRNDATEGMVDLTTVAIGGIVDMYVIVSYSPKDVIQTYWDAIVGRPVLPPTFALGWNQCKWGYKNTQALQDNVKQYADNKIPLDTQWSDIDYLSNYRDFTVDQNRFSDLGTFVKTLKDNGQHWVPIIDAGIAYRPWGDYDAYTSGVDQNVFIQANPLDASPFIGSVWPNEAVYPDFMQPAAGAWWQDQLQSLHDQVAFDGLWLDMNEASNFCTGACKRQQAISNSVIDQLKIVPTNRDLAIKSISLDAVHMYEGHQVQEIDAHSLFGSFQVMYTHGYFEAQKQRTFIIERSSNAGMGKYGSRWLGDNYSSVQSFESSILGTMMMGMFGIPLVGSDICGFSGNTTPELCARWTVAGAFYPFSRNHNDYSSTPQEPYQFKDIFYEDGISYMDIMKQGILNKYHLIKYYYTHMFLAHKYGEGPIFNAMWYQFPDMSASYSDPSENIMIGPAFKLSVLTNALNQNSTQFFFPAGAWCDVFVPSNKCMNLDNKHMFQYLSTKAYDFHLHLQQGHIVPMQDATALGVTTTAQLTKYPVDLHILGAQYKLGFHWYAQGMYVNDDGLTTDLHGNVNEYIFSAMTQVKNPQNLQITFSMNAVATNHIDDMMNGCAAVNANDFLGNIYIYNAEQLQMGGHFNMIFYYNDGTLPISMGQVQYNEDNDRIEFINAAQKDGTMDIRFCMTRISKIVFTNF